MKVRDKNDILRELIVSLDEMGRQEDVPLWSALAKKLNRPRRKAFEVNLSRIERHAGAKETVVVPGCVLGSGSLQKPLTIAALKFSKTAEEKIRKAGGKAVDLGKFVEGKPAAKNVRIMG